MADSDITVSGLVATPGIGHIALQYSTDDPHEGGLLNLALDVVEVHASTTNDRTTASKVAEGNKTNALHVALTEGTTWYYWIKARNRAGYYGDWHPSGATAGLQATAGFAAGAAHALINGKISISANSPSSNQLTVALKTLSGDDPSAGNPVFMGFTGSDGSYTVRAITAATSLTISNGSTLGVAADNRPFRIWWEAFDNDGTVLLAGRNCSTATTVFPLAEDGVASTIAEGGAGGADSAGVFYAGSAVSAKQFRIIGYSDWDSGLATAGVWASAPTRTRLFGPGGKTPGDEIQSVATLLSTYQTTTAAIPGDDTIPQSSEGAEFFSTSITPTSQVNLIDNSFLAYVSHESATLVIAALFQDSGANALRSAWIQTNGVWSQQMITLQDRRQPGTTAATTYKVRMGGVFAGGTMSLNGISGGRYFGGTLESSHRVREVMG